MTKKAKAVTEGFKTLTLKKSSIYLQTDMAKEFMNNTFLKNLKNGGITFFTREDNNSICALAEKMIFILQGKMWRYFTHKNTYTYVEDLIMIHPYNHTFHTTLGSRLVDVNPSNSHQLLYRLFEKVTLKNLKEKDN